MSIPSSENLSPMMRQYFTVKEQYADCILFFRLGDFYEMFFDDAKRVSSELELTLTGRDCGLKERAPMCGVPYHSAESYISRLIKKGYKVAICEQMEEPSATKGMVRREVIRVVTPGTVVESAMLDEGSNNFIASIYAAENGIGFAFSDITTGEIYLCDLAAEAEDRLKNELGKIAPSEVIFNADFTNYTELGAFLKERLHCTADLIEDSAFSYNAACQLLCRHFKADSIGEMGLSDLLYGVPAAAALLGYVQKTHEAAASRIVSLNRYSDAQFMNLDLNSRRNLELTETMRSRERHGSLLWVIDKTKTAMGKRLLRSYVEQPLINPTAINKRLNAVTELFGETMVREDIRELLAKIPDLERLMTRVIYGNIGPRELKALEGGLRLLPLLKEKTSGLKSIYLKETHQQIDTLTDVADCISCAIREDPPALLRDGGVIRQGFSQELDELRDILSNAKKYIAGIETAEREKTGIKNLRISYNKVFGYFIEVTKSYTSQVPETYIRKQTLTNCERYITPELKTIEEKILGAGEKIAALEVHLYEQVRSMVAGQVNRMQETSSAVSRLDVYADLAHVAVENNYCCPTVDFSGEIDVNEGRHPVVEKLLEGGFVSNNTFLNKDTDRVAVITGPNMAGKSTFMRQTALIVLMAQMGSYVPASRAHIGTVDGIYTRVGAADDLASGQSTFMVEMNEVSYILKNATSDSLLILDEIGRGTSTFDGMSIARAVVEHIADKKKLGCKALFATHYHELTELENRVEGIKNYNVAVIKKGYDITFLRRIIPGGADDSYGIEVSRLAGIPESILKRAHAILDDLEQGRAVELPKKPKPQETIMDGQLTLTTAADHPVISRIRAINFDQITPLQALNLLYELKSLADIGK